MERRRVLSPDSAYPPLDVCELVPSSPGDVFRPQGLGKVVQPWRGESNERWMAIFEIGREGGGDSSAC